MTAAAAATGQFRVMSRQFGYSMFAASVPGNAPQWSDQPHEAHVYDERDNRAIKLAYWQAYARRCGLDGSAVWIEAV